MSVGGLSVLLVDDDRACRDLMSEALNDAGFSVASVGCGEEALPMVRKHAPRLVVLDVNLPGLCGYEVCRQIKDEAGHQPAVLFVSGERVESLDRVAGLLLGADDYLVKPFSVDELIARVRCLLKRSSPSSADHGLTSRESEILGLLSSGLNQREIGEKLVISSKTVDTHIQHILTKLKVRSRAEAVAFAFKHGLAG